jgi:P22 coat protein - gene protein 5
MPNTLLTVSQITRKAAMTLHQKSTLLRSVNRQYDSEFGKAGGKIGDTLRVRMPNEYTFRSTMTYSAQDVAEQKVDLPVSQVGGVDMQFTSLDLALSLDDFNDRFIEPAVSVIAANVENTFYQSMYKKVYNIVDGDAASFAFSHLNSARQVLTDNLAPASKRFAVLNTSHATKFMNDTKGLFHSASNIQEQYEEGIIGRTAGFNVMESTIIADHTTANAAKTTGYTVNGAVTANGSVAVTVQTGTTLFNAGDVFTVAGCFRVHPETKVSTGVLQQFVVTSNYAGGAGSLTFTPAIYTTTGRQNVTAGGMPNSGAIVKVGAGASELLNGSLAFYRDAFTFVTADLPMPKGTDMAASSTYDGITVSLVRDFDIATRDFKTRLDILYGFAALRPQLACRIHADG